MKKIACFLSSLLLTLGSFAQFSQQNFTGVLKNEILNRFEDRKEKGYYSIMQVSLMMGNQQNTTRNIGYYPYPSFHLTAPFPSIPYTETRLVAAPSITLTNGYMFNEHWAAGAGVGFEIFNHHLFPLFAELRYTLWDSRISPFVTMKGGYAFGNFKARHYDDLYLSWSPYYVNDATLRHYGGMMLHPEIGVKVPVNGNADLMFTAAYRHQKTKSVARKDYESDQFDEWERKEDLHRISFGVAIMFR
jgi:hypothetical protein